MTAKEDKEAARLRRNREHLQELVPCKSCDTPTERQVLIYGQCAGCRAYDKMRAKQDNDPTYHG